MMNWEYEEHYEELMAVMYEAMVEGEEQSSLSCVVLCVQQ